LKNLQPVFLNPKGGKIFGYTRLWENVWLPASLVRDKVDVFHATCGPMPGMAPCPTIVTIHDLIPLHSIDSRARERQYRWTQRVLERATRVLTPSQYTADDIAAIFGERVRDKIRVVGWAPSDDCRTVPDSTRCCDVRNKYGLPDRFLLAFGSELREHKNIPRLLKAYAIAVSQSPGDVPPLCLTGIGTVPARTEYKRVADTLGIADRVLFPGYVLEAEIAPLLTMAACLLFVSLDEGFGLPPLDAFSCGRPVIAANATSIPEVVGDAALLVDPRDERQIGEALLQLMGDECLRQRLVAKGRTRAESFTWERTAQLTASVIKEVAPSQCSHHD
jgi:glycosyltransferase involved in cell wall biosynthesis